MLQARRPLHQADGLDGAIINANRALSQAGPVFWVTFYGLALILAIVLGTSLIIGNVRDHEINRSEKELESMVRLLSKHFNGQLENFEAVPKSVASYLTLRSSNTEQFNELASSESIHRLLREKISDSTDFAGVNVFDSDGGFLNSSERWPVPQLTVSDRKFFQTFKTEPNSSPVLVQLVDSRISKGRTIVIARKVSSSNGVFLGMVTRSISPERFESFFSTALLADSALALLHRDGSLLAHYPQADEAATKRFFDSPLLAQASTDGHATLHIQSLVDGQLDLASARSLEHYPIYVVATKMSSAALAGWRRETQTLVLAALLAAIVVVGMLVSIVRYLKEQHRRLDIAVNNMSQGLLLFDASERLVLHNQRYLDMFGLSSKIVKPGSKLRDIIQHRKDTGSLTGGVDEYCENIRESSQSGLASLVETLDGRWMQIVNKSVDGGGWVSTIEDVTERRRNEERSIRLASYDTLTELPNRALLRSHLAWELENCSPDKQVAVLFLDMDEFKAVNDTLGHQIGDELLRSVARSLQSCAGPGVLVARLGGDEFALVVSGVSTESQILNIVQRIYQAVRRTHQCSSHQLAVDTSIGIAVAPSHGSTCDEILQNADLAMYDAKSSGKRTYRFFEPQLEKKAKDRRQLETDLRTALEAGSIEVNYQPILDLQTNQIVCCEALARWTHPERGYVSPAEFIPVAEQSGLIEQLGEYVLRAACNEAASWPSNTKVAVNVSPAQFRSDTFALKVVAALGQSGLPPHRLEIEITEAVLIGDDQRALMILHELKAIGVRVALDDFGTGYSSLSYLRRFPFDKIKIDRSFISDLTEEDSSSAIVRAVVAMAAEHKMVTTAEGVETLEQRQILRDLNCSEMQGFLFSKARPGPEITKMMAGGQGDRLAAFSM
jgi:diguanylate cyclase (GGDEF)-like protein/PAS domain S-box-containing protein